MKMVDVTAATAAAAVATTTVPELGWEKMSIDELEKQYSPSRWSPHLPHASIIEEYMTTAAADIREARARVPWGTKGTHDNGFGVPMDVYGEDLPAGGAMLVFIHGGYWQSVSKDDVGGLMGPLYSAGILTVVLSYTIAPKGTVAGMVEEIKLGLQQCLRLAETRGSSAVVVAGWSAGAQLLLQALSSDLDLSTDNVTPAKTRSEGLMVTDTKSKKSNVIHSRIKGIVTLSGIFDLRPLVNTYVNEPLKLTSSDAWLLSPSNPKNLETLTRSVPHDTRLMLATAEYDSPQFRLQADQYCALLRNAGFSEVERCSVTAADHFTIIADLKSPENLLSRKLLELLKRCICAD